MQGKGRYLLLALVVAVLGGAVLYFSWDEGVIREGQCVVVGRGPDICPDYAGVVVPPNIAPLNFVIREEGTRYFVKIHSARGEGIEIFSRSGKVRIPLGR